ncbi:IPT/TIG domain-containing protein [uncultured Croceitalea sp.]|uniref:IPT/TIG domain-containing protein n=1 Tax=uncultured Croceitalea sp. TaxID=1798908 RepID=UPI0033062B75
MKTTIKLFTLVFALFAFVACSDDDDTTPAEFTITAISPESGSVGTEITITGTNFPTDASAINLTFDGVTATISSASSTQVVTTVPAGASSGTVSVVIDGVTKAAPNTFTVLSPLIVNTAENIFAPQIGGRGGEPISGEFVKFNFATGEVSSSDTEWDIALRGTRIAVNGGTAVGIIDEPERNGNAAVSIQDGLFSEISSADGLEFTQDGEEGLAINPVSDLGWYNYNPAEFVVTPIPGKILVFRTHDGKYAKVEIKSYYENSPANPVAMGPNADAARYYTFDYVYNPNEGETSLAN